MELKLELRLGVRVTRVRPSESRSGSGCPVAVLGGDLGILRSLVLLNPSLVLSKVPKVLL